MANVNDSYFDGYYKDIWRSVIPAELTPKEVDFIVRHFGLQPGSRVLDIMCGYGRHAIALGEKGMEVTAVDNLDEYVDEIRKTAKEKDLSITPVKADVSEYEPGGLFDLAICMGNSLCFFDEGDVLNILQKVGRHVKKRGSLLINTWMIAEIAFNGFREKAWSQVDGMKFITESKFYIQPTRIEYEHLIIAPDGKAETKKGIDYIYSLAEMEALLKDAGFRLTEVYSIPGRKKFTLGEPRAYLVASKE